MLRPASPGTGVIAGGGVRAVVEAAGIKDVLAKSLGSGNHANVVKATLEALSQLAFVRNDVMKLRGIKMRDGGSGPEGMAWMSKDRLCRWRPTFNLFFLCDFTI